MNNNSKAQNQLQQAIETFRQTSLEYAQQPDNLASQIVVIKAFEALLLATHESLSSQLKNEGESPQSKNETILTAQDMGLVDDADIWIEALDYQQKLKKSNKPEDIQQTLDFSQTYFADAVDNLANRLGI